ncbi:selenium metabolism-associated LysR family transcriptional regulator [Bacillus suaedae]|uniref:LysR family transcriptional regulator n=1 Tax=Halalkalibacter suaedae TaxID=2822140 RepID=A0A940WRG1_9BACI|nr:LysR family transcriptional regulator [Bacillus suaedae]
MNLKRIKTFMLLIDHKNFSTTADILDISQPAVSKQIKALEVDLGTQLVHRDSLEPTEAGRIVYVRGKDLLHSWKQLEEECTSSKEALTGLVKIGASSIPSTYIVPRFLKDLLTLHRHLEVELAEYESEKVLELIKNEKLDIGFVGTKPPKDTFTSHLIAQDQLQLIGPIDSPDIHSFDDIRGLPFVFRSERSGTWKAAKQALTDWGGSVQDLKRLATVHSTESVIVMVESGLGYSIVSDLAARLATKYNRVKILATLPLNREFYCVYSPYMEQDPKIKALIELLKSDLPYGE